MANATMSSKPSPRLMRSLQPMNTSARIVAPAQNGTSNYRAKLDTATG